MQLFTVGFTIPDVILHRVYTSCVVVHRSDLPITSPLFTPTLHHQLSSTLTPSFPSPSIDHTEHHSLSPTWTQTGPICYQRTSKAVATTDREQDENVVNQETCRWWLEVIYTNFKDQYNTYTWILTECINLISRHKAFQPTHMFPNMGNK